MRRFAQRLAEVLSAYGYEVTVDAHLTSRSRTQYTVPLVARRDGHVILADGDPTIRVVDEVEVHRLVMAATDLGCRTALYIHDGILTPAAAEAAQDRVHFWSRRDLVPLFGEWMLSEALGLPLHPLPAPLGLAAPAQPAAATFANLNPIEAVVEAKTRPAPTPPPPVPETVPVVAEHLDLPVPAAPEPVVVDVAAAPHEVPAVAAPEAAAQPDPAAIVLDLEKTDVPEPAPVYRAEPEPENRPTITMAETDTLQDEEFLDLGGADLADALDENPEGLLPEVVLEPEIVPLDPEPAPTLEAFDGATPAMEPVPAEFEPDPAVVAAPASAEPVAPTPTGISALMEAAEVKAPEAPLFALPPAFKAPEPEAVGPAIAAPEGSLGLLPPRLTLAEAKAKVSDRLFDIEEAELILQPIHLFDYAVELLREGSLNMDVRAGRLQVNGTDRKVLATDPAASDPKLPHRVFATPDLTLMDKVCRVSPERARQVASDWATAQHAKTVEVNGSSSADSFDLVEKKTIGPTSGQVKLTYLGLWHRPFWRLWGNNGHADIDAVEGITLDAEIKGPNPDVMLVD